MPAAPACSARWEWVCHSCKARRAARPCLATQCEYRFLTATQDILFVSTSLHCSSLRSFVRSHPGESAKGNAPAGWSCVQAQVRVSRLHRSLKRCLPSHLPPAGGCIARLTQTRPVQPPKQQNHVNKQSPGVQRMVFTRQTAAWRCRQSALPGWAARGRMAQGSLASHLPGPGHCRWRCRRRRSH